MLYLADAVDAYIALFSLGFTVLMLVTTWAIGRAIERRHLRDLADREARFADMIVTNLKRLPPDLAPSDSFLIEGSVVVGSDYFKRFVAGFKQLVGGRLRSLEGVLMRGRREAVLRMLEAARAEGADAVFNIRIEASAIGGGNQQQNANMSVAEILAYGTAVRLRR